MKRVEVHKAKLGRTILSSGLIEIIVLWDGCSYLKSKVEITVEEAKNMGLKSCSRCKP